jgi:hypothetical protein
MSVLGIACSYLLKITQCMATSSSPVLTLNPSPEGRGKNMQAGHLYKPSSLREQGWDEGEAA